MHLFTSHAQPWRPPLVMRLVCRHVSLPLGTLDSMIKPPEAHAYTGVQPMKSVSLVTLQGLIRPCQTALLLVSPPGGGHVEPLTLISIVNRLHLTTCVRRLHVRSQTCNMPRQQRSFPMHTPVICECALSSRSS